MVRETRKRKTSSITKTYLMHIKLHMGTPVRGPHFLVQHPIKLNFIWNQETNPGAHIRNTSGDCSLSPHGLGEDNSRGASRHSSWQEQLHMQPKQVPLDIQTIVYALDQAFSSLCCLLQSYSQSLHFSFALYQSSCPLLPCPHFFHFLQVNLTPPN